MVVKPKLEETLPKPIDIIDIEEDWNEPEDPDMLGFKPEEEDNY